MIIYDKLACILTSILAGYRGKGVAYKKCD